MSCTVDCPSSSGNQRLPSGPAVMTSGTPPGSGYSVTTPLVVIRPSMATTSLLGGVSVNQRSPSEPVTIWNGPLPARASGNSVICPAVVTRAILLPLRSATHRLPSGPAAIPIGELLATRSGNSVRLPSGVSRPTIAVG